MNQVSMARSSGFLLFAGLLVWFGAVADGICAPKPNVIVFITEDQSCHLGCLATKGLETPNIDRFAGEGTIFSRAFALSPVCSPSKMALLTGTYPHTNSAIRNVPNYGVDFPLPAGSDPSNLQLGGVHEDLPTLIELMKAEGVFTAVSSKSHVQPIRKFPFDRGYPNPSTPEITKSIVRDVAHRAKSGSRPYFLWLNIASPHLPFPALLRANDAWDENGGLVGDGGATNIDADVIEVPDCYPDVPAVRQDFADYLGNIEVIDGIFQAALDALRELNALENTVVLFTSDHGIGLHRAKQSIYSAGLQIPLIVRAPDSVPSRVLDAPVSHLDVTPTVLDYLGIDQPGTMLGRSLRPLIRGDLEDFEDRPTILTACHDYYSARAVTDGRYYYVRNLTQPKGGSLERPERVLNADQYQPGMPWFNRTYPATVKAVGTRPHQLLRQIVEGRLPDEELYDLSKDRWMVENLIEEPERSGVVEKLRRSLEDWREQTGDEPSNLVRRE